MTLAELDELMELKGWNEAILAGNLHLSEAAVKKWRVRKSVPDGPGVVLMSGWLAHERKRREKR